MSAKGSSASARLQQCPSGDRLKRSGDVLLAFILIAFTLPLMSIVALAIKLDSPGPIFSRQECLDRGGRRVKILKFRTSVGEPHDGERTEGYRAQMTRVGWLLRFTRIADLPQLINVVRGELTLIGAGPNRLGFFGWW